MSLKERLANLRTSPARMSSPNRPSPLPYLLPMENEQGMTYYKDKIYIDYHGQIDLKNYPRLSPETLAFLSFTALQEFDVRDAVFLDIETTGTAGGAGTVAFLVGLGFLEEGYFQVRQYFLHDLSEEAAFLDAIRSFCKRFRYLITYNGKCFDAQILRTRYLLHRWEDPLSDKHHIDMLFVARRLWKRRFQVCDLVNLERNLLGFERADDIPSYLIPSAYTDYLRFSNAIVIQKVIDHNQWDILSLAVLTARACLLQNDNSELSAEEHFSLSLLHERRKEYERALDHQLDSIRLQHQPEPAVLLALSRNLRRVRDQGRMRWLLAQIQKENLTNELCRRLCIICEHDLKDYDLGVSLAEAQIQKLERFRGIAGNVESLLSDWHLRRNRLVKKQSKSVRKHEQAKTSSDTML